ncbi:di-heme-cytochrome C peroxidase [Paludisphaera borealis]|uniref:Cytochrome c domain-containing protein n=1 Tax=Paludisphaera borealis TaxID=1387353 RepID=A0A1U7CS48_9BACT|nr:di-heme-cytochrome C peroxidase [Paludisphaera borealis]APW61719.1 hypothetical protein BSF38_03246 [Paludisphaera borealis]
MRLALGFVFAAFVCGCVPSGDDKKPDVGPTNNVDPARGADPLRNAQAAADDPLGESVAKVVYLDQGWSASDSLRFYFTAQGSQIIPYDWFLALEQADSSTPFRDAKNMLRFRYLPQSPGPQNLDGLPVGFVADKGVDRSWLGLTCAACHTTEIHHEGTAYRIDGGPTMGDVGGMLSALIESMQKTHDDAPKFDRFAAKVLGTRDTPSARALLKLQVEESLKTRIGYNTRNFPGYDPAQPAPPPTHYGRLDALGAIVNEVYHHAAKEGAPPTSKPANAPVSYPFLWDTPTQNLVQWVGLENGGPFGILSLARNVGEVIGVFGGLEIPPSPTKFGYSSTVRISALRDIEDWVKTLKPPKWPAAFPPIDTAAAALGKTIYQNRCASCHPLIETGNVAKLDDAKTDRATWDNFFVPRRPSGKLEGAFENVVNVTSFAKIGPQADAPTMVRNAVIGAIVGGWKEPPPDELSLIAFQPRLFKAAAPGGGPPPATYKARPLDGIWATAPYLHNGSVANLDDLLKPAGQRLKSFSVGTRTFDPVRVGFRTDAPGFPKLDVTAPGSSNVGHDGATYGADLTDDDRHRLLEYLKTL